MTKVNQRTATVNTLLAVLSNRDVDFEVNGETPINDVLTPADKESAREILFTMFRAGEVEYKAEFQAKVDDDSELKKYVSGLVNNWVRKAKELNCGEAYKPKNPGSRAGASDPQIKELRKLLQVCGESDKPAIQEAINNRLAEIKPESVVTIDVSQLPEHLRSLVSND